MMRFNGIGPALLGVSKPDADGISTATRWFTFLYLPLVPICRQRVRFHEQVGDGYTYSLVGEEKLVGREVLRTYLECWLMIPAIVLAPGVVAVKEVWQMIGLPESIHIAYIVFFIIWVFAVILKVQSNYDKRRSGKP